MKTNILSKSISATLVLYLLALGVYGAFEPAIISAVQDQVEITLTVTSEITITSPSDITMSPSIPGLTGGAATGTATWTVVTNDSSGFSVTHVASSSAMLGDTQGDRFYPYTTASATTTDYTWSVPGTNAEFGYSTVSYDDPTSIATMFLDTGAICGAGSNSTFDRCWKEASTTAETIMNRSTETTGSGVTFTIDYQAESGSSTTTIEDTYTATTTVTATTN